jgi:hypothetical protein
MLLVYTMTSRPDPGAARPRAVESPRTRQLAGACPVVDNQPKPGEVLMTSATPDESATPTALVRQMTHAPIGHRGFHQLLPGTHLRARHGVTGAHREGAPHGGRATPPEQRS